ncbi:MAG: hypothetical protein GXP40_02950, partial [Chloroflexi bacterium]|nr:hypothetical protein [Chloroflexota bacterium]
EKGHYIKEQMLLPLTSVEQHTEQEIISYRARLETLLRGNLDFHERNSKYATHAFHSFPAKFPPQLPRFFIDGLTRPGEIVLDPMAGSGTTLLEAHIAGRRCIGLDIDPLALRIAKAKVLSKNSEHISKVLHQILDEVRQRQASFDTNVFETAFASQFDEETRQFIRYWFDPDTYKTLFYLANAIQCITDGDLKLFFEVAFSSIIITKNGGVSLALDLAHTRPHRAKIVFDENNFQILNNPTRSISSKRLKLLTKKLRPVLLEFEKRVKTNLQSMLTLGTNSLMAQATAGDAQSLPLQDKSVDLIITSPPYASNAIDYMRAHKFSLVWFGYPIGQLGKQRKKYIGGESAIDFWADDMPTQVTSILKQLQAIDPRKVKAVHRYYTEMRLVLQEMYRVLKPGKAAILVVGTSVIRGIDIKIANCLTALGKDQGFEIAAVGIRNLDRNRRMLPTGNRLNLDSQIQQRMHQEFVIGFYKPAPGEQAQ